MKKIFSILAFAALFAFAACEDEVTPAENTPAVNVTTEKLNPNTDESGTVRAYVGTQVTALGLNLDKVGKVTIDGLDATIVSQEMKTLVFEIPDIGKGQQDDPYMVDLVVYDADATTPVFKYDYFVTIPVTDALVSGFAPASGTVGTVVTISGRNLGQVTSVSFGGVAVSSFVSQEADAVEVAVPLVNTGEADSEIDITAVWSGGILSFAYKFTLSLPKFDPYTQESPALLGDEVTLTGKNLDLVSAVKWGDETLLISDQGADAITVKIPTGLEQQTPAVVAKALTAVYGVSADQILAIAEAFRIDTTPVGPAAPVFASIAPTDTGYDKIFLGREVTVKGENFASIEKFKIDGIEVALNGEATDIDARFTVPRTITGTAKKQVSLVAVWNGGNELDCGEITVYPFFFTKGLRIGIGSNSKNTYPDYNRENAFILLDEGKVISVDEFKSSNIDPFALSGSNTVTPSAGKVAGSETDYYSVQPYLFAISNSAHKLSFCNPANTANQLKCHFDSDKNALPTTFGTPVIYLLIVTDETLKASVSDGTLDDIATSVGKAGSGAPALGTSEGSTWVKGSVLGLQYTSYDYAKDTKKPDTGLAGVRKVGYVVVRDITCADLATGLANTDREGYIELDLYWSNVL
ncbi:MAG: IPT/TIG domain-containing protein [Bacteroidales bacterium]|nr:IPT/TIG domain-containing protein [Bacteroidales bacterium]